MIKEKKSNRGKEAYTAEEMAEKKFPAKRLHPASSQYAAMPAQKFGIAEGVPAAVWPD
jgi:hypothetical protein